MNNIERLTISQEKESEVKKEKIISFSVESLSGKKINEDKFLADKKNRIFGVFDGIGRTAAGEIASEITKETIEDASEVINKDIGIGGTEKDVEAVLKFAHEKILEDAKKNPERKKMGTTASVVKICKFKRQPLQAVIANVGDSRVYLCRKEKLKQITSDDLVDDSVIQLLTEKGSISSEKAKDLNDIVQYLGKEEGELKISIQTIKLNPGDKLLLCTDGITGNLDNFEIEKVLGEKDDINEAVKELVSRAQNIVEQGEEKTKDDITALMLKIEGFYEEQQVTVQRSDGRIEKGWYVEKILPENKIKVRKDIDEDGKKYLIKEISEERLKEMQNLEK